MFMFMSRIDTEREDITDNVGSKNVQMMRQIITAKKLPVTMFVINFENILQQNILQNVWKDEVHVHAGECYLIKD